MLLFRSFMAVLIAASTVLLSGCGNGNPTTCAVTGTVTYRGKPVEGASVMFMPADARPGSALTDADGRFTLRTYKDGDGVVAGENVVCIAKMRPDPNQKVKDTMLQRMTSMLPARYATPVGSPLKINVTANERNDFSFDLID